MFFPGNTLFPVPFPYGCCHKFLLFVCTLLYVEAWIFLAGLLVSGDSFGPRFPACCLDSMITCAFDIRNHTMCLHTWYEKHCCESHALQPRFSVSNLNCQGLVVLTWKFPICSILVLLGNRNRIWTKPMIWRLGKGFWVFFLSMQKNLNIDLWTQGIPGAQRNFRLPAPGNLPACLADNPKFQMSWAPEVGTALGIWAPEWWWQQPTLSSLLAKVAGFWFSWNKHYGC